MTATTEPTREEQLNNLLGQAHRAITDLLKSRDQLMRGVRYISLDYKLLNDSACDANDTLRAIEALAPAHVLPPKEG